MAVRVEIEGDEELLRRFIRARVSSRKLGPKLERKWAFKMKAEVRKNALPFKDTGGYDRSIVVRNGNEVHSRHPAGPRLEHGFVGVDALGRRYAQAPRPHWRTARLTIARDMAKDARKEVLDLGN